jgi:hypothetical protein
MRPPLHVFIVASPLIGMVAYEFVAERKLNLKNVLIVFIRGQKIPLFHGFNSVLIKKTLRNKMGSRLPNLFHTFDESVKEFIESFGREFLMYTPWLDAVASVVLNSKLCIGHSYLEEGDQAYKNFPLFSSAASYDRKPKTELNKHAYRDYWRDDAKAWIGITEKSFLVAPPERRVILQGFQNVKNAYSPVLQQNDCVLLMPTPGRLPRENWGEALFKLNMYPKIKTFLKLHPAFYETKNVDLVFLEILKKYSLKNIEICDQSVILEAEMMFNPLVLIGDRSSLSRYAKYFGSTFIKVPFLHSTPYGEMD